MTTLTCSSTVRLESLQNEPAPQSAKEGPRGVLDASPTDVMVLPSWIEGQDAGSRAQTLELSWTTSLLPADSTIDAKSQDVFACTPVQKVARCPTAV